MLVREAPEVLGVPMAALYVGSSFELPFQHTNGKQTPASNAAGAGNTGEPQVIRLLDGEILKHLH